MQLIFLKNICNVIVRIKNVKYMKYVISYDINEINIDVNSSIHICNVDNIKTSSVIMSRSC